MGLHLWENNQGNGWHKPRSESWKTHSGGKNTRGRLGGEGILMAFLSKLCNVIGLCRESHSRPRHSSVWSWWGRLFSVPHCCFIFQCPAACAWHIVDVINVSVGRAPIGKLLKKGLAQEHVCRELPQLGSPSKLLPGVWYGVNSPGTA